MTTLKALVVDVDGVAFFTAFEARTVYARADLALLDDRLDNVEAARVAGWRGLLWDGTRSLTEVLKDAGTYGAHAANPPCHPGLGESPPL